jgi:hypothetical protein
MIVNAHCEDDVKIQFIWINDFNVNNEHAAQAMAPSASGPDVPRRCVLIFQTAEKQTNLMAGCTTGKTLSLLLQAFRILILPCLIGAGQVS